jgi:hypothetical protein
MNLAVEKGCNIPFSRVSSLLRKKNLTCSHIVGSCHPPMRDVKDDMTVKRLSLYLIDPVFFVKCIINLSETLNMIPQSTAFAT